MTTTPRQRALAHARRHGVITSRDAVRHGIHSQQLTRLVASGELDRVARGQYREAGDHGRDGSHGPGSGHLSVAEREGGGQMLPLMAARAVPGGVICLLSALPLHGIGAPPGPATWIAIRRGMREPNLAFPPLRIMRFSGDAFTEGIEKHLIDGEMVRVYSLAKTLADLFKFRNQLGLDVAVEALREGWRSRKLTVEALERAGRACRVDRVMRPYVEAVVL